MTKFKNVYMLCC